MFCALHHLIGVVLTRRNKHQAAASLVEDAAPIFSSLRRSGKIVAIAAVRSLGLRT